MRRFDPYENDLMNPREQQWLEELAESAQDGRLRRRSFLRIAGAAGLSLSAASSLLGVSPEDAAAAGTATDLHLDEPPGFEFPKHNYLLDKESPFEVKNVLIEKAKTAAQRNDTSVINVGRGNPDFLNTTVRHAFAQMVHFAADQADQLDPADDFGYRVEQEGLADRLKTWLDDHADQPGTPLLSAAIDHLHELHGGDRDELVYQVTDAANGDFYPDPGRILPFAETAVRAYLEKVLFRGKPPEGQFHLFATEGATASMIYVFGALKTLHILQPGDKVAIFTPIFSPYLELPRLAEFGLEEVHIPADPDNNWHVDPDLVRKTLQDPKIKALYLINPANPGAVALTPDTISAVADTVRQHNPDLMVINDTVYANFAEEFHTLSELIPENTIGCYSFSKYFGVTGWRLGVISTYETCVVDRLLAELPEDKKKQLRERYSIVSPTPDDVPFRERLEIESRDVALAHTGGLSCPQQVIMSLFSLFEVLDTENTYNQTVTGTIAERWNAFYDGLGTPARVGNDLTRYYAIVELDKLAASMHGDDFAQWLTQQWDLGFLFHLAEDHSTVCLPGDGFAGPDWSIRIAVANQTKQDCQAVGNHIVSVLGAYHSYWQQNQETPKVNS
ncbi:bifunctional aspartate transaminase/aspartate 4-decarboxylase [Allorhodopirellula solitaria]|uniref:Aminotransferase n=1 Tax=Allorhodopirellula solitaria TaxID=2527987 RepID=A0A5C5XSL1_9BACT|nr:bifunctional aspartate transaminase/aspartate 4-decarboxylase [Allorhodopirellula solitaria]TWT65363.1 Bifunctional aspartate aminotransferase and L-aspartate beta-decarboxylase [Allorhodopirellula solitaria]